jgi:hypothetical protein
MLDMNLGLLVELRDVGEKEPFDFKKFDTSSLLSFPR